MLTATTKNLLVPISDAVAQLIVIASHAELANAAIPDLREVAAAVAAQVYNLADLGGGLLDTEALVAETGGEADVLVLQERMKGACDQVREAAKELTDVASLLAADPLSGDGRARLIGATRGILNGTRAVLDTCDDAEVEKIILVSQHWSSRINQLLETTLAANGSNSTEDAQKQSPENSSLDLIRQIAQQAVFLFHLVTTRTPEILSPYVQSNLIGLSSRLESVSHDLVANFRINIIKPNLGAVADICRIYVQEGVDVCTKIQEFVKMTDVDESSKATTIDSNLDDPTSATSQANHSGFLKGTSKADMQFLEILDRMQAHMNQTSLDASVLMNDLADLQACQVIANSSQAMSALQPHFAALNSALESPALASENPQKKHAAETRCRSVCDAVIVAARAASLAARGDVANGIYEKLSVIEGPKKVDLESLRELSIDALIDQRPLSLLLRAAANGKPTDEPAATFLAAVSNASDALKDVGLDSAAARLTRFAPGVVAAASVLTDAMNAEQDAGTIFQKEAALTFIGHTIGKWNALVQACANSIESELAIEAIVAASVIKLGGILSQLSFAKVSAGGSEANIHKLTAALARGVAQITASLQREANNSTEEKYQENLRNLSHEISNALTSSENELLWNKIEHAAVLISEEKRLPLRVPPVVSEESEPAVDNHQKQTTSEEEVVVVYAEAPQLLSPEEAKENPLRAAAQELTVESSKWATQENPVVVTATDIAARLTILAEHYRSVTPASKIELLESTKEVVVLCKQLSEYVAQIASTCTDKRLCAAILAAGERLPTLSQQLKILVSVKAGTTTRSQGLDAEKLLVTCACNLMSAVREVLHRGEAASIRCTTRRVAIVGTAVVKFKRNLFKGSKKQAESTVAPGPKVSTNFKGSAPQSDKTLLAPSPTKKSLFGSAKITGLKREALSNSQPHLTPRSRTPSSSPTKESPKQSLVKASSRSHSFADSKESLKQSGSASSTDLLSTAGQNSPPRVETPSPQSHKGSAKPSPTRTVFIANKKGSNSESSNQILSKSQPSPSKGVGSMSNILKHDSPSGGTDEKNTAAKRSSRIEDIMWKKSTNAGI